MCCFLLLITDVRLCHDQVKKKGLAGITIGSIVAPLLVYFLKLKKSKRKQSLVFLRSLLDFDCSEGALLFYAQQISTSINSFYLSNTWLFSLVIPENSRLNSISRLLLPLNSSGCDGWYKNFRCCHIHWEVKCVNVNNRRTSLSITVMKNWTECT